MQRFGERDREPIADRKEAVVRANAGNGIAWDRLVARDGQTDRRSQDFAVDAGTGLRMSIDRWVMAGPSRVEGAGL